MSLKEKGIRKKPAYSLLSNFVYMLKNIYQWTRGIFFIGLLRIPLLVLLPFLGILMPKMILDGIAGTIGRQELFIQLGIMVLAMMVFSAVEQYGFGRMRTADDIWRSHYFRMIEQKEMDIDYEILGTKDYWQKAGKAREGARGDRDGNRPIGEVLVQFGASLFGFLLYSSLLITFNPLVLLLVAVTALISFSVAGLGARFHDRSGTLWGPMHRRLSRLTYMSADAKAGKDIRLYSMQGLFDALFHNLIEAQAAWFAKMEWRNFIAGAVNALMVFLRDGVAYAYLIWCVLSKSMTPAEFVLYFGAVAGFSQWLSGIAAQLSNLHRLCTDTGFLREYLDIPGIMNRGPGALLPKAEELPCEIVFEHVFYRYPDCDKDTICDFCLTIRPGERLALVGVNGAGKTTIVKLLCGLYRPTSGRILVNGKDSTSYNRDEYYRLFSTVFQEVHLLPLSIRENISHDSMEQTDRERLHRCLQLADLEDKVYSLPLGPETLLVRELNEGAVDFSGGETQRLLLARALYKDSPVLVLDEPTAALDPIAENNIYLKYHELTAGRTSLYISHRLASTRFCNRILFLEDGRVAEMGTHDDLILLNGKYARMFRIQSHYYRKSLDGADGLEELAGMEAEVI